MQGRVARLDDAVVGSRSVEAGDLDAGAVGRGADAAALIATDLARCTNRRAARHTHLTGRFTEELDAPTAERSANAAAFVAAILAGSAEGWTAWFARGLLRRAVLVSANLAETDTLTAALIAAVLARTAHHLIARLAHTQILGAWNVVGNADAATLGTAGRALDAENRRARVVINRQADTGAVRAASSGIATIAWIVDALESLGTRDPSQSTTHAARSRDLRKTPPLGCEGDDRTRQPRQHTAPGA
jgi:hypothetical protein